MEIQSREWVHLHTCMWVDFCEHTHTYVMNWVCHARQKMNICVQIRRKEVKNLKKNSDRFQGESFFFSPFCLKSNCHLSPNSFLVSFYHTDALFLPQLPLVQWLGNMKIGKTGRDKKCENKRVPYIFVKTKSSQHILQPC